VKPALRAPLRFAAIAIAAGALGVRAEDAPPPPPPPSAFRFPLSPSTASLTTPKPPPTVSVDFPGGTIAQLVAVLTKSGSGFNLIGDSDDLTTVLPAISVQNANVYDFAQALDAILRPHGLSLGGDWNSNIFAVEKRQAEVNRGPGDLTRSYPLTDELKTHSLDEIEAAVRAAWQLDPTHDAKALRLLFDAATKLLLISGPPEAVHIAFDVIGHISAPRPDDGKPDRLPPAAERH